MAVSWLKKGEASAAMSKQDEAEKEKRKAEQGKMWRFWLEKGEEGRITFVDGDLNADGYLVPPRFYEHQLYLNGNWNNLFVCPEKTNPDGGEKCPICEGGDRPSLVALFTVIDHRTFKSKDGDKSYTNTPKILVAKSQSFDLLNKLAQKRGGLAGVTFDVSRSKADKSPAVGDLFDFVEKNEIEVLKKKYTREITVDEKGVSKKKVVSVFVPADYDKEIVYRSEQELRALGFGKAPSIGMVGAASSGDGEQAAGSSDYESQL